MIILFVILVVFMILFHDYTTFLMKYKILFQKYPHVTHPRIEKRKGYKEINGKGPVSILYQFIRIHILLMYKLP